MTQKSVPLVIHHFPCLDGFTAAWACWLAHPDAEFVHGVHGEPPPDVRGRDVYLLDFSYKRAVMERLVYEAEGVVVLDHHKTAEADLANLPSCVKPGKLTVVFDMEKSGARLAWEWFHPGTAVPLFVRLVEDRDLWRFDLQDTREMNAAFFSYEYDFVKWTELWQQVNGPEYAVLRDMGAAIERKHHKDVKELLERTRHIRTIGGVEAWCANMPYTMASDAAHALASNLGKFGATYFVDGEGWHQFSLRSTNNGMDVSEVAARYGGGGHARAAGFRVRSLEDLCWEKV